MRKEEFRRQQYLLDISRRKSGAIVVRTDEEIVRDRAEENPDSTVPEEVEGGDLDGLIAADDDLELELIAAVEGVVFDEYHSELEHDNEDHDDDDSSTQIACNLWIDLIKN